MATVKLGAIITEIHGKLGGQVFRTVAGQTVLSNKVFSQKHKAQNNALALTKLNSIFNNWSNLSDEMRNLWNLKAKVLKVKSVNSATKFVTGRQLFIKLNGNLLATNTEILTPEALFLPINTLVPSEINLPFLNLLFPTKLIEAFVTLQGEVSSGNLPSVQFSRRKTFFSDNFENYNLYNFNKSFFETFPNAQINDNVRLYISFMNRYGFKLKPKYYNFKLAVPNNVTFVSNLTANGVFSITVSGTGVFYWGDGTNTAYTGASQVLTHTYVNFNGTIYVTGTLTTIYKMSTPNIFFLFNIANIPTSVSYVTNRGDYLTGLFSALANNLLSLYFSSKTAGLIGAPETFPISITSIALEQYFDTSGDLSLFPPNVVTLMLDGALQNNSYTYTSGRVWANNMRYVFIKNQTPLSSQICDDLLNDLSLVTTWGGAKLVYLKGTRTAASDAAVATLQSKGVTVTLVA